MRNTSILVAAIGIGLAVASLSSPAHALGPVGVEIGAKVGAGTNPVPPPSGSAGLNPLGFGLGGRGGITFLGFYGGVNVMYYLGGSQDALGVNVSAHSLLYGLEAGYNISLAGILTIRPQLGFGNYELTGSAPVGGVAVSTSSSYFYLEPGLTVLIGLGTFFVGADANLLMLPAGPSNSGSNSNGFDTAFTAHGQIGVKF